MIFLIIRGLPWLIGLGTFLLAQWQWRDARSYPYPLLGAILAYAIGSALIAYRRLSWQETISKMLPAALTMGAIAIAFLLAETPTTRLGLSIVMAGIPALTLELLWLLAFDPARYPVHGLSRLNHAFLPAMAFFTTFGLAGLNYFIRIPDWSMPLTLMGLGAIAFHLTTHHAADRKHQIRWTLLGALVGLQAGILAMILPLAIAVQGALAAILFAIPSRIRRYTATTVPSPGMAWTEGIGISVLFLTVLLVSRWA